MFVCPECGASYAVAGSCTADRFPLAAVGDDVLLGATVGAYRVARLLGVGGMGRVYKGVQPQIGSRVAIKVLSRECSERRDLVERFFSEARAVNLIRHESIVNVLDLAHLPDGRPYIIMEYLDGAPLASIVEGVAHTGPLPLGSVARLIVEALEALDAAHQKGIVHRDLKPDNLFVTPSGRPKILDFGIAKLLPELGGTYTQTGSLLGTPHYMSPEQASGRPVDYRADLYAMGVILFECVTGTKPFDGGSLFDLLRKQVDAPPPRPVMIRPDLPPAYEHVILTALGKSPDQRWGSAQAMGAALQQATATLPPEQWGPLTPSPGAPGARSASGAGWDSTGGRWSHTPHTPYPSPLAAAPIAAMTPAPGPMPGHPTTVAGQASAPRTMPPGGAKRSMAGVWIALAVLVAGGGITAAILAGRGGGPVAAGTGSGAPLGTGQLQIPSNPRPAPGGWVAYHALAYPGWDPRHVDVEAFIQWSREQARQMVSDAELNRIDLLSVFPDGHADLTLSNGGFVGVRFLSPSRRERDPSVPIGAQGNLRCMFQIMATAQTGAIVAPLDSVPCDNERAQPTGARCTVQKVWQKMIAQKAPSGNVIAQMSYFSFDKAQAPVWVTGIAGIFSAQIADDCQ